MKTPLKIIKVKHCEDYILEISFSNGSTNYFNYKNLVTSGHEEFNKYLNIIEFKKFKIILNGDSIAWGKSWDMMLPIIDLYSKKHKKLKIKKFRLPKNLKTIIINEPWEI